MTTIRFFGLLILFCFLTVTIAKHVPLVDYDVIIVGGGPAGLSALSGLSRVRRTALLIDSAQYRNAMTRNMHDVIGNDGVIPSIFRHEARQQIRRYITAEMKNGTVLQITPVDDVPDQLPHFVVTINMGSKVSPSLVTKKARKVVLATGIEDLLPSTPGIQEAWSRGIYWCPWCDGFEHRDQPLGILGNVTKIRSSIMEIATMNHDIMAFTNGTQLPESETKELQTHYKVKYNSVAIKNITHVQDGGIHFNARNRSEFDIFSVHFEGGAKPVNRSAFLTNFESKQRSDLPYKLGLKMVDGKIENNFRGMTTSMPGLFAVGDCNNDDSTNVPHAMFSGKRAAVYIHIALENENATAMNDATGKRAQPLTIRELEERAEREIGNEFEALWRIRSVY
ncbi:hypothetical protein AJ78_02694 [Emergomyces pasteurianus Ep9510]|uniref:FAD/NAD(P)-binding domain-containing protein n=1 Tax=Emergomyces pasteurianus Ep9510 TaxID=1447872 RepID=A0A1J9PL89_9EURO|nr:hypothetical protein AJ78_02694 [Emergomyces pasteurianus Ep9510]